MQFRPWEVCSLDDPWSFAASHSLMHFINRCTWKSSQSYIIISMMTSFICMSQKLVFHQSKCICAIKRILSTAAMHVSPSSFMYLCTTCYCDACLNSSALRVGVKTLLNTMQWSAEVAAKQRGTKTRSLLRPGSCGKECATLERDAI